MRHVNLVLIGPPGSGKGTQAERICERYGVPAVSTGDILRAAVRAGTPLGARVQAIMQSGGLVDDDLMVEVVRLRMAQPDAARGFILDGFPRTLNQARALDAMLEMPPTALLLDVPRAELERRLAARRICLKCKTLYTVGRSFGSEAELCALCHLPLIRRDDDNIETIRRRLDTYRETSEPIVSHYRACGTLIKVDGRRSAGTVTAAILKGIDQAMHVTN